MRRGPVLLAALAAGLAWPGVGPRADPPRRRWVGLQDVSRPESPLRCPKVDGKLRGRPALSVGQAAGNFNAALEGTVSPAAIRALDADPASRNTAAATRAAAMALFQQRPLAAAGYLHRAHRASPKDPSALVNLAAMANYLGRYDEALAFASGAEAISPAPPVPGEVSGRPTLLTIRGGALLGLDRAREAEKVLREAIALQPDLAEAYIAMGFALGEQEKCDEAARFLVAGRYRDPARTGYVPSERGADGGAGESVGDADFRKKSCVPAAVAVDLTRGSKPPPLPAVPVATTLTKALQVGALVKSLHERAKADRRALDVEGEAATAARGRRSDREAVMLEHGTPSERLTVRRTRDLLHLIYCYNTPQHRGGDPNLERLHKMEVEARKEMGRHTQLAIKALQAADRAAGVVRSSDGEACSRTHADRGLEACQARADWKRHQALCRNREVYLRDMAPHVHAWDRAVRESYTEQFRAMSAAASYLSVPENKEHATHVLHQHWWSSAAKLISPGGPHAGGPVQDHQLADLVAQCAQPQPEPGPPENATAEPLRFCNSPLEDSKLKVGVEVVEVSVGCEQVGVEISTPTPIVDLFVEVGYESSERVRKMADAAARAAEKAAGRDPTKPVRLRDFDQTFEGALTVKVGVKAGSGSMTGTTSAELKGFGAVTVDGSGSIVNIGVGSEATVTRGVDIGGVKVGVELPAGQVGFGMISAPGTGF